MNSRFMGVKESFAPHSISLFFCVYSPLFLSLFFLIITVSPHLRKRKRRVKRVPVTTRTLVWALRLRKRPSKATTSTKKCPFTGNVSIRGRILSGVVVYQNEPHHHHPHGLLALHQKVPEIRKEHSNIAAHISPAFRCKEGDKVVVGQCRPLSKTVRFNVLKVIPRVRLRAKALLRTKKSVTVDFIRVIS